MLFRQLPSHLPSRQLRQRQRLRWPRQLLLFCGHLRTARAGRHALLFGESDDCKAQSQNNVVNEDRMFVGKVEAFYMSGPITSVPSCVVVNLRSSVSWSAVWLTCGHGVAVTDAAAVLTYVR